jgi:hypothetical protein
MITEEDVRHQVRLLRSIYQDLSASQKLEARIVELTQRIGKVEAILLNLADQQKEKKKEKVPHLYRSTRTCPECTWDMDVEESGRFYACNNPNCEKYRIKQPNKKKKEEGPELYPGGPKGEAIVWPKEIQEELNRLEKEKKNEEEKCPTCNDRGYPSGCPECSGIVWTEDDGIVDGAYKGNYCYQCGHHPCVCGGHVTEDKIPSDSEPEARYEICSSCGHTKPIGLECRICAAAGRNG